MFGPARDIHKYLRRLALTVALTFIVAPSAAFADDLTRLSQTLTTSKSEKARLAAAAALGRRGDKRAVRPLIRALRDRSKGVRAMAATSLGRLSADNALPALKRATRDKARLVRKRALEAIGAIRSAHSKRYAKTRRRSRSSYRLSARERPKLGAKKPALYLIVKSATDKSKRTRRRTRKRRESSMKRLMVNNLNRSPRVTMRSDVAEEFGLTPYGIDVMVQGFKRKVRGPYVEIECTVRVALSNERGKMMSFLSGGAKVQIPKRTFRRQYEAQARQEAMENAIRGIHHDVISYLSKQRS